MMFTRPRLTRSLVTATTACKPRYPALPPLCEMVQNSAPRVYRGSLQNAILDWSGTTADEFVIAPADAFVQAFAAHGVRISMSDARIPMGLRKDLHIRKLMEVPSIAREWKRVHGRDSTTADADAVFEAFVPLQLQCLPKYTGLIPGTVQTVNTLRRKYNLKIGVTTGFQQSMVDVLLRDAEKQGFVPDVSIAGDAPGVLRPRPYPHMVFENIKRLRDGVLPPAATLKVDDTVGGIGEGLNAATWTCALYATSTYMDVDSMEQWRQMSEGERDIRRQQSRNVLLRSGAHYVVPNITFLPAVVAHINARMQNGESP
jgi:phosphonoacetaldehyde hydrolase